MDACLAILSYHKIGPHPEGGWPTWYYISREIFAAHLGILRQRGYEVIDMARFRRGLSDPSSLPHKGAMLTFDDASRSVLTEALPVMRPLGLPGVVFVPTKYVGKINEFDLESQPVDPVCGWDDLAELERGGISVQSHGVAHPAFSQLSAEQRRAELVDSRAILRQRMGTEVDFFAYPYGDAGPDAAEAEALLKEAGYVAGCLYGGGAMAVPIKDRYRLARLAMGPDSDLEALLEGKT